MYQNQLPGAPTAQPGAWAPQPPTPSAPPSMTVPSPPAPAPRPKRTGVAVVGLVLVLLAAGALAVALTNLDGLPEWQEEGGRIPEWVRAIAFNETLRRLRLFALAAGAVALLSLVPSIIGRRSAIGKVALSLGVLTICGSAFASVSSSGYEYMNEEAARRRDEKASPAATMERAARDELPDIATNAKNRAFLLGYKLALSTLARAGGVDDDALAAIVDEARARAGELGVAISAPPERSYDDAEDMAAAIHYLLDDAGKQIWKQVGAQHGSEHGALFELGIKLQLLRLFHADEELATGLVESIARLGEQAGVSEALGDLSEANGSAMDPAIDRAKERVLAALR